MVMQGTETEVVNFNRLHVEKMTLLKENSTLDRYHKAACDNLAQLEKENAELSIKVRRMVNGDRDGSGDKVAETTHLYLLVFPKDKVVKIGHSADVKKRISELKKNLGDPDRDASYIFSIAKDDVRYLERSIHSLLGKLHVPCEFPGGITEVFSEGAVDIALQQINLFCESRGILQGPRKGLSESFLKSIGNRGIKEHNKLRNDVLKFHQNIEDICKDFMRINNLLIHLHSVQNMVEYQYDICNGVIVFRIRIQRRNDKLHYFKSAYMAGFKFSGIIAIYCRDPYNIRPILKMERKGNLIQYRIGRFSSESNISGNPFIDYLALQSQKLLFKLPKRSSAATGDLPMLCSAAP